MDTIFRTQNWRHFFKAKRKHAHSRAASVDNNRGVEPRRAAMPTQSSRHETKATQRNRKQPKATQGNPKQPNVTYRNPTQPQATRGNSTQPKAAQSNPQYIALHAQSTTMRTTRRSKNDACIWCHGERRRTAPRRATPPPRSNAPPRSAPHRSALPTPRRTAPHRELLSSEHLSLFAHVCMSGHVQTTLQEQSFRCVGLASST